MRVATGLMVGFTALTVYSGAAQAMGGWSESELAVSLGYRMDSFIAILMSDTPWGSFEHYIVTSPPFFL